MRWDIAHGVRAELHFFSGLSFAGERRSVLVFHDGRWQGDEVEGDRIKSFGIIAAHGTRVTLISAHSTVGWEGLPWRSVVVLPGSSFASRSGRPAVQVPDLDAMDEPHANRAEWERFTGYPQVERPEDGSGWTYGRSNPALPLKCSVRAIRLDRVD